MALPHGCYPTTLLDSRAGCRDIFKGLILTTSFDKFIPNKLVCKFNMKENDLLYHVNMH